MSWLEKYNEGQEGDYREDLIVVQECMRKCLLSPEKIMGFGWGRLANAFDFHYEVCREVYLYGWEFNEGTKKLKALFQQLSDDSHLRKPLDREKYL